MGTIACFLHNERERGRVNCDDLKGGTNVRDPLRGVSPTEGKGSQGLREGKRNVNG